MFKTAARKAALSLSSAALLFVSAAGAGAYGLGWLVDEFSYQWDPANFEHTELIPGLGGVYWFIFRGAQGERAPGVVLDDVLPAVTVLLDRDAE